MTLIVRNSDTGFTRTALTDADGHYRVSALPPGRYGVQAELQGFSPAGAREIALTIGLEFQRWSSGLSS